jgi:hypothetical protein
MNTKGSRIAAPIGGVVAAGTSVVCMASMGAMAAASAAGTMAGMGAVATATPHVPTVTRALQAVGLGALTHVPNAVLQPLLIVLLLGAIGTALWRARSARTTPALALALLVVAAAAGLYASIYLTVSETGYWIALAVLILASILSAWVGRRRGMARTA